METYKDIINSEQFTEYKKLLEPCQYSDDGTELPTQNFFDMDVLTFAMFNKELLNNEEKK